MSTEDVINKLITMILEDSLVFILSVILLIIIFNLYFGLVNKLLGDDYIVPFVFVPGIIIFPILAYFCFYTKFLFTVVIGFFFILLALVSLVWVVFSWPGKKKDQKLEKIMWNIHSIVIGNYHHRRIGIDSYEYVLQDIFRNKLVVIKPREEFCYITWYRKKVFFSKNDISTIDYYIGKKGTLYGKFIFRDKQGTKFASMDFSGFGPWERFYNEMTGLQGVVFNTHTPKKKGKKNAK